MIDLSILVGQLYLAPLLVRPEPYLKFPSKASELGHHLVGMLKIQTEHKGQ